MGDKKLTMLAMDATRALLLPLDKRHKDVVTLLEKASEAGMTPIYNYLAFVSLDNELCVANENVVRHRLARFVAEIDPSNFLAKPTTDDFIMSAKISRDQGQGTQLSMIDSVGLAMSWRLNADFLTLDPLQEGKTKLLAARRLIDEIRGKQVKGV